ncbi:hypothetical protein G6514_001537 [Epicoccum nigrum]|nr:hypothetical protein G6514_001537 [Epicoccum nigrum]
MECASRALAFHSYQTAQEIIYQEHLAKGLTDKYNTLSHQMDQLIRDANSQIKVLQDRIQVQQADQAALIAKNSELGVQFKDKAKQYTQLKRTYDSLKQQQMQPHLAVAAGDEAEVTLRGHRQIDRIPGVRSRTDVYTRQSGSGQRSGRLHPHNRQDSGSSASSGHQRGGYGIGLNPIPTYASHMQGRGHGLSSNTGRKLCKIEA